MSWKKDYYITCDVCNSQVWMDGQTTLEAANNARMNGWVVLGAVGICPDCQTLRLETKNLKASRKKAKDIRVALRSLQAQRK